MISIPLKVDMENKHNTEVKYIDLDKRYYYWECSCGTSSPNRETQEETSEEARKHRRFHGEE